LVADRDATPYTEGEEIKEAIIQGKMVNTMVGFIDPTVDLSPAEQTMLNSILQGAKINRIVNTLRDNSKLRGKNKFRKRYRKNPNKTMGGMEAYKERLDEEDKIDYGGMYSVK
jgi:hypothetical protein